MLVCDKQLLERVQAGKLKFRREYWIGLVEVSAHVAWAGSKAERSIARLIEAGELIEDTNGNISISISAGGGK